MRTAAITTHLDRVRQADLLTALAILVQRNRPALVLLSANLALVGTRARGAAIGSKPARWLAKNAQALLLFLQSLSILQRCAGQAGYRAIRAARRPYRRRRAPRLLRHRLSHRALWPRHRRPDGAATQRRPRFVSTVG